jgi:hypothetical protein
MGNSDSQDSPWPRLGGSHHLPHYSIFCTSPWGSHPNDFLSQDFQMGVPKFSHLGLWQLWGHITSHSNLWLQWGLKQSCSPRQELSNGMSHVAWTKGNWVNCWLLVVGSQIVSLTHGLSFDHNLCFICPNGQCKAILDICASIYFQCYKFFSFFVYFPFTKIYIYIFFNFSTMLPLDNFFFKLGFLLTSWFFFN